MTEEKTAEQTAVTLDLEPQPVHAPATVEKRATPSRRAAAADPNASAGASTLDRILELKRHKITNEELREFLQMQDEWQARENEKAYLRAMAAWKAGGVPPIPKNVEVDYMTRDNKRVHYWHEDLADVVAVVLPLMAAVGLTTSWRPVQEGRGENMLITVETVVTHTAGHRERVTLYAAPDMSGGKNSIQAVKSTISYLERIGLLAILGLAAKGHDNDGRGADPSRAHYVDERGPSSREPGADDEPPPSSARAPGKPRTQPPQASAPPRADAGGVLVISEKQVGLLVARLREKGIDRADVCDLYGVPALEDLPRDRMDEALKWIGSQR